MSTRHINPEGLHRSPAFSQTVVVEQPTKTIYIGGQNGVNADGKVVGPTVGEQASQAFRNLATILESEGASLANIVYWTIAVGGPTTGNFAATPTGEPATATPLCASPPQSSSSAASSTGATAGTPRERLSAQVLRGIPRDDDNPLEGVVGGRLVAGGARRTPGRAGRRRRRTGPGR
jgi:hypothetical protein